MSSSKTTPLKHTKLSRLSTIAIGYPFRGRIHDTEDPDAIVVQMSNVSVGQGVEWSSCTRTTLPGKRDPDWLQPNDILFAARADPPYAVLISEQLLEQPLKAVAAPYFYIIRLPQTTQVTPAFLAWYLNSLPAQRYFLSHSEGSVTRSIKRKILEHTPIAVPPLPRQHTISALVDTIRQQQHIAQQLISQGELLLDALASDLESSP